MAGTSHLRPGQLYYTSTLQASVRSQVWVRLQVFVGVCFEADRGLFSLRASLTHQSFCLKLGQLVIALVHHAQNVVKIPH